MSTKVGGGECTKVGGGGVGGTEVEVGTEV